MKPAHVPSEPSNLHQMIESTVSFGCRASLHMNSSLSGVLNYFVPTSTSNFTYSSIVWVQRSRNLTTSNYNCNCN